MGSGVALLVLQEEAKVRAVKVNGKAPDTNQWFDRYPLL